MFPLTFVPFAAAFVAVRELKLASSPDSDVEAALAVDDGIGTNASAKPTTTETTIKRITALCRYVFIAFSKLLRAEYAVTNLMSTK